MPGLIRPELIEKLIDIGRRADLESEALLADIVALERHGEINRHHWSDWHVALEGRPVNDLINLVRGLTLTEKRNRWLGGSVAGGIWVFQLVEKKDPNAAELLADWVLGHTENSWMPFGGQNYGAGSLAQFREIQGNRDKIISNGIARDAEIEAEAKADREQQRIERQHVAEDRNSSKREAFIHELGQKNIRDQSEQLANDEYYSVGYYPTRCARLATSDLLESLPCATRLALARKLKGRKRGPWGSFKQRLLGTFCGQDPYQSSPWDKQRWVS